MIRKDTSGPTQLPQVEWRSGDLGMESWAFCCRLWVTWNFAAVATPCQLYDHGLATAPLHSCHILCPGNRRSSPAHRDCCECLPRRQGASLPRLCHAMCPDQLHRSSAQRFSVYTGALHGADRWGFSAAATFRKFKNQLARAGEPVASHLTLLLEQHPLIS